MAVTQEEKQRILDLVKDMLQVPALVTEEALKREYVALDDILSGTLTWCVIGARARHFAKEVERFQLAEGLDDQSVSIYV